jgi:RNA polymerase sigma-70 factor (ECF subfamily)
LLDADEAADTAADLVRRAQTGDREAFHGLVSDHYDLMFRFALKFSGHRQNAEDITQLACIKLGRSIQQFRFEAAFTTWLYRLVINCGHDWLKQQKKGPDQDTNPTEEESSTPADGENLVLLEQLLDQIDLMGEGFRETVVLVMGEGMTHAEAAAVLGIKESTVSWRIHEMRKKLQSIEDAEGDT